jgi:hypothetical protein
MQPKNLFDLDTKNPEEIIRLVAGNMIHTGVYRTQFQEAFPEHANYKLSNMPDPSDVYCMIKTGERWGSYERPEELRDFVEPSLLQDNQRIPHECMGISHVVADALRYNDIEVRERFYKTKIRDDNDIIGHWVIEYNDGKKWTLKDTSVPDRNCEPHDEHYYASEIYKMALSDDPAFEIMRSSDKRIYEKGDSEQVKQLKRKAEAMKTMVQDAYTLVHGSFMSGKERLEYYDGNNRISMGASSPIEPKAELFDKYGFEFALALEEPDMARVSKLAENIKKVQK